eukprot:83012-Chlamydomonas_euryale.AAC.2
MFNEGGEPMLLVFGHTACVLMGGTSGQQCRADLQHPLDGRLDSDPQCCPPSGWVAFRHAVPPAHWVCGCAALQRRPPL